MVTGTPIGHLGPYMDHVGATRRPLLTAARSNKYDTIEQLDAATDEDLSDLRGMGWKSLALLRDAIRTWKESRTATMPPHPYDPNVPNCSQHDMGDCPYHQGGPCMFDWEGTFCSKTPSEHDQVNPDRAADIAAWTSPAHLPIGQYRVTLLVTGDAVGPDTLYWMLTDRLHGSAVKAYVETIETITRMDGK